MPIAGAPPSGTPVPATIVELAAGRAIVPVWRNQLGGITFAIGDELHCKWQPRSLDHRPEVDLAVEAQKLQWLRSHTVVPEVVDLGVDDDGRWLVTRSLPGGSAVDQRWKSDPRPAVIAIGVGLRSFHDAVPVDECPFDWSIEQRIADTDPRSPARTLPDPPAIDRLVVCHGDSCAPNTIVADDGAFVGHVDMAAAGVADRWADLAIASWSLEWNFGDGWESTFFDAYGIERDADRVDWYRRLWDA